MSLINQILDRPISSPPDLPPGVMGSLGGADHDRVCQLRRLTYIGYLIATQAELHGIALDPLDLALAVAHFTGLALEAGAKPGEASYCLNYPRTGTGSPRPVPVPLLCCPACGAVDGLTFWEQAPFGSELVLGPDGAHVLTDSEVLADGGPSYLTCTCGHGNPTAPGGPGTWPAPADLAPAYVERKRFDALRKARKDGGAK